MKTSNTKLIKVPGGDKRERIRGNIWGENRW